MKITKELVEAAAAAEIANNKLNSALTGNNKGNNASICFLRLARFEKAAEAVNASVTVREWDDGTIERRFSHAGAEFYHLDSELLEAE